MIESLDQEFRLGIRGAEVLVDYLVTIVCAFPYRNDKVFTVIGYDGRVSPFRILGAREHERIIILRRSDTMKIYGLVHIQRLEFFFFAGLRVAAVIEAGPVARPGQARKFQPVQFVVERLAAVDVDDARLAPIRASILHEVSDMPAVGTGKIGRQRDSAVLGPCIRIDQQPRLIVEAILHVNHVLVLQAVVVAVVISSAFPGWQAVALIVP